MSTWRLKIGVALLGVHLLAGAAEAQVTSPPSTTVPSADLRRRIEQLPAQAGPDALQDAARALLAEHRLSRDPELRAGACAAQVPERPADCHQLLLAITSDPKVRWQTRVRAAAGLPLDQEDSRALMQGLLDPATPAQLGEVVDTLARLPEALAVPPLLRVLESGPDDARVEAARVLPRFVTSLVTDSLFRAREASASGTPLWLETTLAVARLGSATVRQQLTVVSPYYGVDGGGAVGALLFEFGDEQGEPLLRRAAATASPAASLRAAFALRTIAPDLLPAKLARAIAAGPAPRLLAIQLATEARVPLPDVTRLLLDADPDVRLAAASYLLLVRPGGPV